MKSQHKLILASASPRRLDLLKQINITPDKIIAADINETPLKKELPLIYTARIAREKAAKIFEHNKDYYILAADTTVACGRRILPKSDDDEVIKKYLEILSGRSHDVITSVCLITPQGKTISRNVTTKVKFKRLSANEINNYINTGEGRGKAGGYAIQGFAESFVKRINGSYSNVVGLPLHETMNILIGSKWKKQQ